MAKKNAADNKNNKKNEDKKGKAATDGDDKQSKVGVFPAMQNITWLHTM